MEILQNDALDTSWFDQYDKLLNLQNYFKKETLHSIDIKLFYIDNTNHIQSIICEKYNLHSDLSGSFILKDDLLKIIQHNKQRNSIKYKLEDILFFHIPIEHQNISDFNKQTTHPDFLKPVSFFDHLRIPDSIFIFHPLTSLYLFFKMPSRDNHNFTIKSILKKSPASSAQGKTKKVQINEKPIFQEKKKTKHKKTKKNTLPLNKVL